MIECYSAGTVNGQRVVCMLEETGLDYSPHWVDIRGGEHRSPEFLALNPRGRIPVIVDPNGPEGKRFILNQSSIIVLYLADKTGMFLPRSGPRRYLCMQWLSFVITDFAPAAIALFFLREQDQHSVDIFRGRTDQFMIDADKQLASNEFLAGNEISVADICLYPSLLVSQAAQIVEGTPELKHLRRWRDTMAARPGIKRGIAACPSPDLLKRS